MKVTVTLDPLLNRTEDKFFSSSQWLTIEPFNSKIVGLALCLKHASGPSQRKPITDTTKMMQVDVSAYGFFWFAYSSADKEYKINVDVK